MNLRNETKIPKLLLFIRHFEFPKKLGLLEFFYGKKLSGFGVCWVTCWNGVRWKLDLADPCHRWIVFGKYEGGEGIDYAFQMLKKGGVFVDSGSNIGQWSIYLGGINGVSTIAFEPVDSQRDWLTESLEEQSKWSYDIFEYGLGAKDEVLAIQCDGPRSTLRMDWYSEKNFDTQDIELKRLDEVLREQGVDKVTFWKLDVEGAELNALLGAKNYLESKSIENIYFECHPSNYVEICNLLEAYEYDLYYLDRQSLNPKTDAQISSTEDLIALPRP